MCSGWPEALPKKSGGQRGLVNLFCLNTVLLVFPVPKTKQPRGGSRSQSPAPRARSRSPSPARSRSPASPARSRSPASPARSRSPSPQQAPPTTETRQPTTESGIYTQLLNLFCYLLSHRAIDLCSYFVMYTCVCPTSFIYKHTPICASVRT